MKILKILVIIFLAGISVSHAQDVGKQVIENESSFLRIFLEFLSSGIFAFIMCLYFPKFTKKTSALFFEKNKFRILFEGMKGIFILLTIAFIGFAAIVGIYPAILAASITMAIYSMGLPFFSISVLEWLLNMKNVKFDKLDKKNKIISLLSINIILMMIILPLEILVPELEINAGDTIMKVDIVASLLKFIMSLFGIGIVTIRLTELVKKHYKKF